MQVTLEEETGEDVADGTGHVSFGSTDFNQAVTKTFVISNTGTLPLSIPGLVSVTGGAFEVLPV